VYLFRHDLNDALRDFLGRKPEKGALYAGI
jgi:hypothetical protein